MFFNGTACSNQLAPTLPAQKTFNLIFLEVSSLNQVVPPYYYMAYNHEIVIERLENMRDLELPGRSPVHAPVGMAATSHALATQAAIDVLKAGGNAVDGAIAAAAVQNVVEPGSTGIGGDCFCLYAPNGGSDIIAFNGSGKAPMAANAQYYKDNNIDQIEQTSPHAVTVPGALDAWFQLNRDHGKLPMANILAPAIKYARDGYPIASRVYQDFLGAKELLAAEPSTAKIFLNDGEVPEVGSRHYQKELAATLQKISDIGPEGFYKGDVAQDMVDYLQSKGGLHTMEDFANVKGDYVTPISTDFRGYKLHECPPNGQGVIALLLINIMKELDLDKASGPLTTERIHQEIEACRLAYTSRNIYLADPDFADVPVDEILSSSYAEHLRAQINPASATVPPLDPKIPNHEDTVYITVVDKDRNACSLINTVFTSFGSGLTAPNTGILLQSRGKAFSLDPAHPNCIEGGKRPLHTIIPAMLTKDNKTVMSFGVMGGQYQAFGQMQFLTRLLDYGMDIQEAMDCPRFMVDPFTGEVEIEGLVPDKIKQELTAKGHTIVTPDSPVGGSQAIWIDWDNDMLTGGSDPRKDGCAIGY